MMSMNNWTFSGRLGADAELRTIEGGDKVLNFCVSNDIGFGERKSTQWVDCTLWGNRASSLAQYLIKGTTVVVSGEVSAKPVERRNGDIDAVLVVRVDKVDFLSGSRNDTNRTGEERANRGNEGRSVDNRSIGSSSTPDNRGRSAGGQSTSNRSHADRDRHDSRPPSGQRFGAGYRNGGYGSQHDDLELTLRFNGAARINYTAELL